MKNKLKLWILWIEGWNVHHGTDFLKHKHYRMIIPTPWSQYNPELYTLSEAWKTQIDTIKNILSTNIFWLIFPMVLGALFLLFSDNSTIISNGIHWFNYAGLICFIWPVLFTFIGIGTWIIKLFKGGDK